jgi:hypothetical protein
MLRTRFFFGLSVLFLAGGIVVSAQGHGNGPKSTQSPAPKASAVPHATAPAKAPVAPKAAPAKTMPVQASQAKTQSSHAPAAAKTQPVKAPVTKSAPASTTAKASPSKAPKTDKTAPAPAKTAAKADKPAKTAKSAAGASPSTSTSSNKKTTPTTTGTPTTELTPVQQKLKQNTNLAAKVASRLPAGTDLMAAAAGFKNLGQFVAAANVSNNLQIPFAELKAKMVTGGMSLGQAIQAVRPLTASPTIEVQRAEYDARGMIAESEQTTPSTTGGPVTTATTPASAPTTASSPTVKTKVKAKKPVQ